MRREYDNIDDLFSAAKQSVPEPGADIMFDSIIHKMDQPVRSIMPYKQLRTLAVAACVLLLVNIAAWIMISRQTRQVMEPGYLQSYNLNIYSK